jgi:signal transduction histidine kinase
LPGDERPTYNRAGFAVGAVVSARSLRTLDATDEAVRHLRVGAAILFAVQFLNVAADFYAKPGYAARFTPFHLANVVLLAATFALTWSGTFRRHWQPAALLLCVLLLGAGTLMSVLSRDVLPRFVSVLVFSLGCATFLPWGGVWQAVLNLACFLSFAADIYYTGGVHREGAYLWIGLVTTLILAQFVSVYSDRYRRALIASAGELADRDAAIESARLKSLFLATMSHEIRTPLHVLLTYAAVIEKQLARSADAGKARATDAVRRAGRRLQHIVDHTLDISRMEAGAFQVRRVPLNLTAAVGQVIDEFRPLAEEKGLKLVWEPARDGATIQFDEYCLAQALSNLLENAIKYTDSGSIAVRLFCGADNQTCLEVRDSGIGIDPQFMPRVFEPFSQEEAEYSRRFQGAGLGLALVKRYLALNDAQVSVTSQKGSGTTFLIRFAAQ